MKNVERQTVNFDLLFLITSGHPMKLAGSKFQANRRKYSFTKQVIKLWHSLRQDAMEANNIKEFKKCLDKFVADMCTAISSGDPDTVLGSGVPKLFTFRRGKDVQGKGLHFSFLDSWVSSLSIFLKSFLKTRYGGKTAWLYRSVLRFSFKLR